MNLTFHQRRDKLKTLAEYEGFDSIENLLEAASCDSVSPGICVSEGCDYTAEIEPESREGFCEVCETQTVHNALVLTRII